LESQFAGFHQVNQIQSDKIVKSYFHQGGGVNGQAYGEFEDNIVKKGRTYRQEVYQETLGQLQLLKQTINKWVKEDLGNNRSFVKLASTVNYDFADGVMVDNLGGAGAKREAIKSSASAVQTTKSISQSAVQEVESLRTLNSKTYLTNETRDGKPGRERCLSGWSSCPHPAYGHPLP